MNLSEFQTLAVTTAIYPREYAVEYPLLGLLGEVGEVANKVKKRLRDNAENDADIAKEVGDAFWYVAALAHDIGIELSDSYLMLGKYLPTLSEAVRWAGAEVGTLLHNADNDGLLKHADRAAEQLKRVCQNLSSILYHVKVFPADCLQGNIDKLLSRKERGTLQGSGDNR